MALNSSIKKYLIQELGGNINDFEVDTEEGLYATLFCKNLSDLTQTVKIVVNKLGRDNTLPNPELLTILCNLLKELYNEKQFKYDSEGNLDLSDEYWNHMSEEDAFVCVKLYHVVRQSVEETPDIKTAVQNKDKSFFLNNFERLFYRVPAIESYLVLFKNLLKRELDVEDENTLWDFISVVCELLE